MIPQLPQNVARQLQRLGAAHIEGCGTYDDHHMFSLEELHAAIGCGCGRDWRLPCSLAGVWACMHTGLAVFRKSRVVAN